jgi:S1-C subfamily serine protease
MNRGIVVGSRCVGAVLFLLGVSTSTWSQIDTGAQAAWWNHVRIPKPGAMLGIVRMTAKSTMTIGEDSVFVKFGSEPRVREVDPDGPSAGILRSGDVIVAIDSMLITTERAGFRYANLVVGEPVELTIRRSGSLSTVTIIPSAVSEDDYYDVSPPAIDMGRVADLVDSFFGSPTFDSAYLEHAGWLPPTRVLLGMVLLFDGQSVRQDDGTRLWRFDRPPQVTSVQPGGPADLGGLRVGDILTHIDGTRLDRAAGGRKFSNIRPGERIVWTVNRSGRTWEIEITASDHR